MSLEAALAAASAKPAGKRPYFLDAQVERVLAITMALAQELAVARMRIDSLERLLERQMLLTQADIDTFEPTADEAAERGMRTQEYIARVLRIVQQDAEHIAAGAHDKPDPASEDVAALLDH